MKTGEPVESLSLSKILVLYMRKYQITKSIMFPNIHTILRIMLTFPVTTCTCERSISVLNRVKSFNRRTHLDDTLTGLCIICAYRDVKINWDKVINTFANKNPRRMALISILDDEIL